MPLSKDFAQSVRERTTRDPEFRKALLAEIERCFEDGETEVGLTCSRNTFLPQPRESQRLTEPQPMGKVAATSRRFSAILRRLRRSRCSKGNRRNS
jgi:hypothetical protein